MWTRLCLFFLVSSTAGCFQQDESKTSKLLPSDYASTYALAQSCRLSTGHEHFIKVLTDSKETNQAYLAGDRLLPENSLVMTEEYDDANCSVLVGYTLMRKDPGYDPSHNDWHWQELDDRRDVLKDGREQVCIDCHQKCVKAANPEYTCLR